MKDKDGKGGKVVKTTGSLDAKNRYVACCTKCHSLLLWQAGVYEQRLVLISLLQEPAELHLTGALPDQHHCIPVFEAQHISLANIY